MQWFAGCGHRNPQPQDSHPAMGKVARHEWPFGSPSQKSPQIIDEEIRQSRQLVLQAESASSNQQNQKRIEWEANIRKTRSFVYATTMSDFSINGKIWKPNQLVSVVDDFAGINAQLLINSVTFSQDRTGSSAVLALVDKNAYTLKLNEPEKGNKTGEGFTL